MEKCKNCGGGGFVITAARYLGGGYTTPTITRCSACKKFETDDKAMQEVLRRLEGQVCTAQIVNRER